MIQAGISGASIALLLATTMNSAGPAQHSIDIPAAEAGSYTLHDSGDGRSLVVQWQGMEQVIGSCSDRLLQRVTLRRSSTSASVIERNCGATVDYATQVVVDGREGRETVAIFQGRPDISLAWNGRRLQVNRSWLPADKIFLQRGSAAGLGIAYAVLGPPATPTSQNALDESNRNWGANGRAVGLPDEVLLRWAGWAQQASGLHRDDWGNWHDAAPYGDDPRGRTKIREGIDYYADTGQRPG